MDEPDDERPTSMPLNERLLDLLIFVPAGIAASVVEDFPAMAERGRRKLGVKVSSARSIGQFAVKAGQHEFRRRSGAMGSRSAPSAPVDAKPASGPAGTEAAAGEPAPDRSQSVTVEPAPVSGSQSVTVEPAPVSGNRVVTAGHAPRVRTTPAVPSGNIPAVSTLSIPGFDTLSASQVVQRLDGLNRSELVSVRAYEASTRGRRTILSRVDQLLDERS
jgi:hypothetical protein